MVMGMGILQNLKQRKAERAFTDASAAYSAAYAQWKAEEDKVDEMLTIVRDCMEGRTHEQFVDMTDHGFMLDADEFPIAFLQGAAYLEIVKAPSQYSGGYGGVSFPLFGGVRMNTGGMKGNITTGAESISVTDEGHAMVTNKRIMFTGAVRTHEWKFAKLMNMTHAPLGYTVFASSGSGKPAGIGYGEGPATEVQFRLELAAAMARNTLAKYFDELTVEKQKHSSEAPVPPAPVA